MKTDPPEVEGPILDGLRGLPGLNANLVGDYVLIGRCTLARDGQRFTSYDWFYRPGDGQAWAVIEEAQAPEQPGTPA